MTIRETGRFCKVCGREMEFIARGARNHEYIGSYICGCCAHQECGAYCEMFFSSLREERVCKISFSELAPVAQESAEVIKGDTTLNNRSTYQES